MSTQEAIASIRDWLSFVRGTIDGRAMITLCEIPEGLGSLELKSLAKTFAQLYVAGKERIPDALANAGVKPEAFTMLCCILDTMVAELTFQFSEDGRIYSREVSEIRRAILTRWEQASQVLDARNAEIKSGARRKSISVDEPQEETAGRDKGENFFQLKGEAWHVVFGGREALLSNSVGMKHLHRLISSPGVEIDSIDLVPRGDPTVTQTAGIEDSVRQFNESTDVLDELIDPAAREDYRLALVKLKKESAEAERLSCDTTDIDEKMKWIKDELKKARPRPGGAPPANPRTPRSLARTSALNAIKRALNKIETKLPELGAHLEDALRTGNRCVYRPTEPIKWVL